MNTSGTTRKAGASDIPRIQELQIQSISSFCPNGDKNTLTSIYTSEDIQRIIQSENHIYCYILNEKLVAYCLCLSKASKAKKSPIFSHIESGHSENYIYIEHICVDKTHRNKKIATHLYIDIFSLNIGRDFFISRPSDSLALQAKLLHDKFDFCFCSDVYNHNYTYSIYKLHNQLYSATSSKEMLITSLELKNKITYNFDYLKILKPKELEALSKNYTHIIIDESSYDPQEVLVHIFKILKNKDLIISNFTKL